jgi:hypothetical protein
MVLLVMLATLACGSLPNLGNLTGNMGASVDSLWEDVPAYPGASRVDMEMPAPLRLAVEAASQASAGRLPGDSGTLQDMQFIAFTTSDAPQQIQDYYSNERMAAEGWNVPDAPGCGELGAGTQANSAMCVFAKETPTKNSALFLVAGPADDGGSVIFYMRADGQP